MTARRDWVGNRLHAVGATRRMLVVVSDGCPMDGATALANGERYLDANLEAMVARRECQVIVAIRGLVVGLDLNPYCCRSLAIDAGAPPSHAVLRDVAGLIARG